MITYNLRELNQLAKKKKFNRDTLEKVLRLSELFKVFNEHIELKGKYILKGGTAINLCLFDFPRLSVDIDMNFNLDCTREEMLEIRELHRNIIKSHVTEGGYTVDPKSRFTFTLDSYLLKYINAVGSTDNVKVELNYSNRIQILDPIDYTISSSIVDNEKVLGLNKIELYGSKIAALIGRTTARDVYDVSEMIKSNIIVNNELSYLRKCSIFYLLTSNEFQPLEELIKQFKSSMQNMTFRVIRRSLIPMMHTGVNVDLDQLKKSVVDFIEELFILTQDENKFVNSFIKGEYKPELLFKEHIASKIKEHPMALWKMMNYKN